MRNVKEMLGDKYKYERLLSDEQIKLLQNEIPEGFTYQTAAYIIAGCVKIEATLYKQGNVLKLGYDVFVKDEPEGDEWFSYDTPDKRVSFKEKDMFNVLNSIVEVDELSYTDCHFEAIDGKVVKIDGKEDIGPQMSQV